MRIRDLLRDFLAERWAFVSQSMLSQLSSHYPAPYAGKTDRELQAGLDAKLKAAREWMREKRIERAPTLKLFPPPNSK
jgi:hypothetical protein